MKLLYFLLLILFVEGCIVHYSDIRLQVNNQSEFNIYVQEDVDTINLRLHADIGFMLPQYFIKSGSTIRMKKPGGEKAWEEYINESPDKKLHLYVFSEDTLKKYTKEQVIEGKKYLERLDVSVEELKANDWKVIYFGENK